jgi:hypothetical protein
MQAVGEDKKKRMKRNLLKVLANEKPETNLLLW